MYFKFPFAFQTWESATSPVLSVVPPLPPRASRWVVRLLIIDGVVLTPMRCSVLGSRARGLPQFGHQRYLTDCFELACGVCGVLMLALALYVCSQHSLLAAAAGIGLLAVIAAYLWRSRPALLDQLDAVGHVDLQQVQ